MKYIRELIKKLSSNDIKRLIDADFSHSEIGLIKHYKEDKAEIDDTAIADQLALKVSSLKKLQSTLLLKIISFLASEDIFEQVEFLSAINCHRILLHIGKKRIRQFKKDQDADACNKLILKVLYSLLSSLITDYSLKDLKDLESSFFSTPKNAVIDTSKLYIFILILEIYQIETVSKNKLNKFKIRIDKIKTLNNVELNFWKNELLADYYNLFDEEKYINMIQENYDLLQNNKSIDLPLNFIINTKVKYCFYLMYHTKIQEIYDYYFLLRKEYPNSIGGKKGMRYTDMISQVCIALGKYTEAKNLIFDAYPIERHKPGKFAEIYFGNTTILAMIDILENNFDAALERINTAKIGLKKQYFLYLDSLLRLVEQAYYYITKDYSFADSLYQKNLKFYQYHKDKDLEEMANGHKVINAYCKQIFDKKPLTDKHKSYIFDLKQREFCFIGHFIEQIAPSFKK